MSKCRDQAVLTAVGVKQARSFRVRSTQLRRKMWYKNIRIMVLIGLTALLVIALVYVWFKQ